MHEVIKGMVKLSDKIIVLRRRATRTERLLEQAQTQRLEQTQAERFQQLKSVAEQTQRKEFANIKTIPEFERKFAALPSELKPFFPTPEAVRQGEQVRIAGNIQKLQQTMLKVQELCRQKKHWIIFF